MDITGSDVDPLQDVYLALQTATSVQESIRHADAKAQILLSLDCGIAVVAVDHAATLLRASTPLVAVMAALLGIVLAALALAAGRLLAVIAPRLAGPRGGNRFAFPSLAAPGRVNEIADVKRYRDDAWQLVATLSTIATAKYTGVRRAIPSLGVALVAIGALFTLALASGSML
jgi:hypothetical protein